MAVQGTSLLAPPPPTLLTRLSDALEPPTRTKATVFHGAVHRTYKFVTCGAVLTVVKPHRNFPWLEPPTRTKAARKVALAPQLSHSPGISPSSRPRALISFPLPVGGRPRRLGSTIKLREEADPFSMDLGVVQRGDVVKVLEVSAHVAR